LAALAREMGLALAAATGVESWTCRRLSRSNSPTGPAILEVSRTAPSMRVELERTMVMGRY
jgi:hypothetical protein